jgi:hypothetical protein
MTAAPPPAATETMGAPADARSSAPSSTLARLRPERRAALILACVAAAGVALIFWQHAHSANGYMTDDAFISFRYARNLADGHGPVWSPGDRVEGYTNFGLILLMGGAMKLGIAPDDSSRMIGLAASLAMLALVPLLTAQLRPALSRSWWGVSLAGMAALAINPGFALWTFAGLETPLVAALLMAAITAHLYEERTRRYRFISPPLFLAAALVRPDAIVFWAITAAFRSLSLVRVRNRESALATATDLAAWGALFALPFGIYWLWRWNYYGDFFPNTYYLKADHSRVMAERGWDYTRSFISTYSVWLCALAVVPIWRELRSAFRPVTYLAVLLILWGAYIVDSGGDWMPYFRFFLPVLPLAYVLIAHSVVACVELAAPRVGRPAGRSVVPAALALLVAGMLAVSYRPTDRPDAENPAGFVANSDVLPGSVDYQRHRMIGEWLRDNVPRQFVVAQIATGIVPYYSQLPTLDMLGVNDRHIARRDIPLGYGAAGHEKEDGGYVISRKPELIWLDLTLEPAARTTPEDYTPPRYTEWVPVKTNITRNAYVWLLYRPVAIALPGGWLNLLVRHDVDIPALPAPDAASP